MTSSLVAAGPALRRTPPPAVLALVSYALLTYFFWGVFVSERGLPGETGFVELSETRSALEGFLYPYSPARRFMSASFHLAYLLSDGSYLSLHLVVGAWILASGIFGYLLVRRLAPQAVLPAYLVGALCITSGADAGANWPGYVVQRQATLFGLLAVLLLLEAWRRDSPVLVLCASLCQYISLWTYEACLPVLLFVPALLLFGPKGSRKGLWAYSAVWSAVPLVKLASLAYSRWILHEASYEASVLAGQFSVDAVARNLLYLMGRGLSFWTWPASELPGAAGCDTAALSRIAWPLAGGLLVFGIAFLGTRRLERTAMPAAFCLKMAFAGLIFMALAYGSFALLATVGPMRTQLVSAVPAAAAVAGMCAWLDSVSRSRGVLLLAVTAVVVGCGLASGLLQQLGLSHDWAGYRRVMRAIVDAAPCVRDGTMVLLVQVPTRFSYSLCANDGPHDPFRDVMWFNSGLQVLYRDTKLVGLYYRTDGSGSDSIRYAFTSEGAALELAGVGVEEAHVPYRQMIAFRYDEARGAVLLDDFPASSVPGASGRADYRPRERISCTAVPVRIRRRLGL